MTKAEEIYHANVNYEWNNVSDSLKNSILKAINEALNMHIVTGSIGKSTKPILTYLKRTQENKHIIVCDLCIFKDECDWNENRYDKCLEDNTDDQYYL